MVEKSYDLLVADRAPDSLRFLKSAYEKDPANYELGLMISEEGQLELDFEDEVIAGACITRGGEIVHEGAKQAAGAAA